MTRGRNKELIAKRDEMLCRRYHYWTEIERIRFDDALTILSEEEFFLSEDRILTILRNNSQRLSAILAESGPAERGRTRRMRPSPFPARRTTAPQRSVGSRPPKKGLAEPAVAKK